MITEPEDTVKNIDFDRPFCLFDGDWLCLSGGHPCYLALPALWTLQSPASCMNLNTAVRVLQGAVVRSLAS